MFSCLIIDFKCSYVDGRLESPDNAFEIQKAFKVHENEKAYKVNEFGIENKNVFVSILDILIPAQVSLNIHVVTLFWFTT